jgi:alkylation response protein AidB-like acyl-CoA dehydrogenase
MGDDLTERLTQYVDDTIVPYLEVPGNEERYPTDLLNGLAELGVFGATVATEYGGLGLPASLGPRINEELARGWQSLIALVGTHFGLCAYFATCGTREQQAEWLPQLASGKLRGAHAYHERSRPRLSQLTTTLTEDNGRLYIDGEKNWVTNASAAARVMVICRDAAGAGIRAAWIPPDRHGLNISPDLPRTGIKGVPLNSVSLARVEVAPDELIGGPGRDIEDFMVSRFRGADVSFTARAAGAARAILEETKRAYAEDENEVASRRYVNADRVVEMEARVFAIQALVAAALADTSGSAGRSASFAKVTATRLVQEVAQLATAVVGGAAYASPRQRLHRACRDAMSLTLVDTTNGTLLGAIADDTY